MAFVPANKIRVGATIKLDADAQCMKGTMKKGSVCTIISTQDGRGEFMVKDLESGETIGLHPSLSKYHFL